MTEKKFVKVGATVVLQFDLYSPEEAEDFLKELKKLNWKWGQHFVSPIYVEEL